MKAFSDLEQSKVLSKILPLESADFGWNVFVDGTTRILPINDWDLVKDGSGNVKFYHAWSLAALLDILPNEIITDNRFECHYQIHIHKYDGGDNTTLYQIAYGNNRGGSWHDMINTGEKESLTWNDIRTIDQLLWDLSDEYSGKSDNEGYYKAVLSRFKAQKG